MRKKRGLLFFSLNFCPPPIIGGSAVVYDQICRRLSSDVVALGSTHALAGAPWLGIEESDAARPYIIHRLRYMRFPDARRRGWAQRIFQRFVADLPLAVSAIVRLVVLITRYRVRVVCLGELMAIGWLVFPLRYALRRRVLIYTHGEEMTHKEKSRWLLARIRGACLRHASGIIAVSRFCKGEIVSRYGVHPDRICVVRNGVDLDLFSVGTPECAGLPEHVRNCRIILSVGRLVARKGQEQLLRAMPHILARVADAHCVIVGEGELGARLKSVAIELGVLDHCSFLSGLEATDLVQLYRSCDVFVLPCRTMPDGDTEGFGLVFLEANACGAPVVAGAAGGTIEAVDDGRSGLLIEAADIPAISNAVVCILSDASLAKQLGSGGIRWAAQHDWQSAAEEFRRFAFDGSSHSRSYAYQSPLYATATVSEEHASSATALLVTMDVEEQLSRMPFSRTDYAVTGAEVLSDFHESCVQLGVHPVYLLSWPVIRSPEHVKLFRSILREDTGELGIQLHSWLTPPFWEEPNAFTSYQCNLPEQVERRKLEVLCHAFEEVFGQWPMVHRAGRSGGSDRTSDLLAELGIRVDFSADAGYSDPMGIAPDHSNIECRPFWSGAKRNVLTVPASSFCDVGGSSWLSRTYLASKAIFEAHGRLQEPTSAARRICISPESGGSRMLVTAVREMQRLGMPIAALRLHSTSLYAGGNLHSADEAAARALRARTMAVIRECVTERLLLPTRAGEVYARFASHRKLTEK